MLGIGSGQMYEQSAVGRLRPGDGKRQAKGQASSIAPGEQTHGGRFHIAFNAGHLAGKE